MKLVFRKNEEREISVLRKDGEDTSDFKYVEMIRCLINTRKLGPPDIEGDFSVAEKESIRNMVKHINDEVTDFYSEE